MTSRLRRRFGVAVAAVAAIALLQTSFVDAASAAPNTSCTTAGIAQAQTQILDDVNYARAGQGLAPLARNYAMNGVATGWSQTQAARASMGHNPNYAAQIPGGWSSAGENVAYGYTPSTVTGAWLNSPGHRANILNSRFTHLGVGVACTASGVMYFTQVFGGYAYAPPPFFDVNSGTTFAPEITWLADNQVSTGWSDGTYRPYQPVLREAMAAFLYRLAGSPYFAVPTQSPFIDVPVTHVFYKEIAWLASAGISTGWETPAGMEFRPSNPIARGEMAAFIYRYSGADYEPSGSSPFLDVASDHVFDTEIQWMAEQGISTGWDAGEGCRSYRPSESVSRDVMAAFLYRTKVEGATPITGGSCLRTQG